VGIFLGLLLGVGILLILDSGSTPSPVRRRALDARARELLAQAGIRGVTPLQLYSVSALCGLLTAVIVFTLSATYPLALAIGGFAAVLPWRLVARRRAARTRELRGIWPEVVDHIASAVRAGLSLPEALAGLAERGPASLRPSFDRFAQDYRATGAFIPCLGRLADELADPVADRIIESLRIAREVGGTDLGRLMRTLSQFLREDARTRSELETRQGWTVNAARLALAAPWVVLLLLCVNGTTLTAYNSPVGVLVLAVGGGASVAAYLLMKRIGQLPTDRRIARGTQ
jgi:tight adherence protein B